jgi:hypothetical protein
MNEGMAALQTRGVFENGIYRRTDNPPEGVRRNQDAFEAIWEEVNGRRITYPEKRWEAPVMMRPQDVEWTQDAQGVSRKTLGTFGTRGTEFALLRLDAGMQLDLASRGGARIGFILSGEGDIDSADLRPHSAFGLKAGEGAVLLARTPLQLMLADMPAFAKARASAAA